MKRQTTGTAHLKCQQLLLFAFALQYSGSWVKHRAAVVKPLLDCRLYCRAVIVRRRDCPFCRMTGSMCVKTTRSRDPVVRINKDGPLSRTTWREGGLLGI